MKATIQTETSIRESSGGAGIASGTEADLEERKRQIAYQLWEEEGRPEGKAEEHWNRACLILMSLEQDRAAPGWLQRRQAAQAAEAPIATQTEPAPAEAPLDAIRRRIAERKTA
jgi:hypothetical protein